MFKILNNQRLYRFGPPRGAVGKGCDHPGLTEERSVLPCACADVAFRLVEQVRMPVTPPQLSAYVQPGKHHFNRTGTYA
jgi:hypothetical protein